MKLSAYCINCLVKRQLENITNHEDEELKSNYMKKVLSTISKADEQETAPVIIAKINKLHQEYFGVPYSFEALKKHYNILMLQKEESIWNKIQASDDSLLSVYCRINMVRFGSIVV